jgi:peptide/nickel transport system substrate-binding protein
MIGRTITPVLAALLISLSSAACSIVGGAAFRVALTDEPLNLSAAYEDESSAFVGGLVHAGLYRPDATLLPQPLLAEGPPLTSAGGTTVQVTLRSGLIFHNGSPLTAEDVVFTYELAKSGQCPLAPDICDVVRTHLEAVESESSSSVRFRLISSWAPWRTRGMTIPILPKGSVEESLRRFQESISGADRTLITVTRENIAAQLDATACAFSGDGMCLYAPYVGEMERVLSASGLPLPDVRIFPAVNRGRPTVVTRNDESYARDLYSRLTTLEAYLLAPAESQLAVAYPLLDIQLTPIGAGPYRISERTPGSSMSLDSFKSFALGAPKISSIRINRMPSESAAVASFQSSQVDWVPHLSGTSVADLSLRDGATLLKGPSSRGYVYLAFNLRPGRPFADGVVRAALSSCVDLDLIAESAASGSGFPVSSTITPGSWALPSTSVPEATLNRSEARSALLADGWQEESDGVLAKLGTRLEAEILVRDGVSSRLSAAQSIADQAAECGFSITVSAQPYRSEILPRLQYPGDFDAYIGSWQWSLDPDDSDLFLSTACPTEEAPAGKNIACWQNERADVLLRQAATGSSEEVRAPIYAEFQALRRSERPYLLLWADAGYTLLDERFTWPTRDADAASPLYAWSLELWSEE